MYSTFRKLNAVLFAILLSMLPGLALAQFHVERKLNKGVLELVCRNAKTNQVVACPDQQISYEYGMSAPLSFFVMRRYAEIDQLYTQWCAGQERFPDGRWKIWFLGEGFKKQFEESKSFERDFKQIQEWQRAAPNSEAAHYVEAIYWQQYAWHARGRNNTIAQSKEALEIFAERQAKALDALKAIDLNTSQCPAPLAQKMYLLIESGGSKAALFKTYQLGIKRFPEYHDIYLAMGKYYDPLWGGSAEKFDQFARRVAEKTRQFEGKGMYARLFWTVYIDDQLLFKSESQNIPNWEMLRDGYKDLMKKYPYSIKIAEMFLNVACNSRDSTLYRSLREKILSYEEYAEMQDSLEVCDRRHHWNPRE